MWRIVLFFPACLPQFVAFASQMSFLTIVDTLLQRVKLLTLKCIAGATGNKLKPVDALHFHQGWKYLSHISTCLLVLKWLAFMAIWKDLNKDNDENKVIDWINQASLTMSDHDS